jgi:predicted nucleic acid-binding Zn ribbon protein
LLSAPNFRLKGGGWYETDFKNKNKRNLVDGDKPAGKNGSESAGAADSAGSGKAPDAGKPAGSTSTDAD